MSDPRRERLDDLKARVEAQMVKLDAAIEKVRFALLDAEEGDDEDGCDRDDEPAPDSAWIASTLQPRRWKYLRK